MAQSDGMIRRAGPADAKAVRALTREAYAKWIPLIGREPLPMTADYDVAVRDHLVDVIEIGGEMAALIEMIPASDHLMTENIAVRPSFQKRGLGRRLMAHAEETALVRGLGEMRLFTNIRFVENIALYEKLGYRVDLEETVATGIRVNMSKRL